MSPRVEDVVVVGAGIAGLALARELRARGLDPLLVDRGPAPATEATAKSAWMIRTDAADPETEALARRGGELWRSGELGIFRRTGGFLIGEGEDDLSAHVPRASGRGRFVPGDGVVDASSALLALRPPRLLAGFVVADWRLRHGTFVLRSGDGRELRSHVLVDAAGAWAGRLGALPLQPLRRHVALTSSRAVPEDAPFCWDLAARFYFRAHEDGLLLCACDEIPSEPGDGSVDREAVAAIVAAASRLQPGLGEQRAIAAWSGQRTFAPDRRFVAGWDPRTPGLFHVAGLGGHGITVAPALAEACASAIARGPAAPPHPSLRSFDPARLLS